MQGSDCTAVQARSPTSHPVGYRDQASVAEEESLATGTLGYRLSLLLGGSSDGLELVLGGFQVSEGKKAARNTWKSSGMA